MANPQPEHDHRIETVDCSVYGAPVTVQASYARLESGQNYLVDFACSGEGLCGIPAWDPCPLYVRYLEARV